MRILMAVIWCGVVLAALGGCAAAGGTPEQMIASTKALDGRFVKAFNRADLNQVMETYWSSPDVVVYSPDGELSLGWNAVKDSYDRSLPQLKGAQLELTESHYRVEGDLVLGWGTWRMTMPPAKGGPGEVRGCYTEVAGVRHGAWVYLVDHPAFFVMPEAPATKPSR